MNKKAQEANENLQSITYALPDNSAELILITHRPSRILFMLFLLVFVVYQSLSNVNVILFLQNMRLQEGQIY